MSPWKFFTMIAGNIVMVWCMSLFPVAMCLKIVYFEKKNLLPRCDGQPVVTKWWGEKNDFKEMQLLPGLCSEAQVQNFDARGQESQLHIGFTWTNLTCQPTFAYLHIESFIMSMAQYSVPFNLVIGLYQLLRKTFGSLVAKCFTMFTS